MKVFLVFVLVAAASAAPVDHVRAPEPSPEEPTYDIDRRPHTAGAARIETEELESTANLGMTVEEPARVPVEPATEQVALPAHTTLVWPESPGISGPGMTAEWQTPITLRSAPQAPTAPITTGVVAPETAWVNPGLTTWGAATTAPLTTWGSPWTGAAPVWGTPLTTWASPWGTPAYHSIPLATPLQMPMTMLAEPVKMPVTTPLMTPLELPMATPIMEPMASLDIGTMFSRDTTKAKQPTWGTNLNQPTWGTNLNRRPTNTLGNNLMFSKDTPTWTPLRRFGNTPTTWNTPGLLNQGLTGATWRAATTRTTNNLNLGNTLNTGLNTAGLNTGLNTGF